MERVLEKLRTNYPSLRFTEGSACSWSPKTRTITYTARKSNHATWALLHELAHAELTHDTYQTDFELLLLEVAAWDKAKELAVIYDAEIDEDHIQDCLDTYRDWLYQRATCPKCTNTSLQKDSVTYNCYNCNTSWTVTASRFCRPYRLTSKQQKTPSSALKSLETTFL